jgi:hypothetical protein
MGVFVGVINDGTDIDAPTVLDKFVDSIAIR